MAVILDMAVREGLLKELAFKRYLDAMREGTTEYLGETHSRGRER